MTQSSIEGYISKIETMGMVDGPGVRTILFLSGCPLRCLFCHNPDMWSTKEENKTSVEEVMKKLRRFKPYYGQEGGVTFCGGEPLAQPKFLLGMMKACKAEGISTCLDTSGFGTPSTFDEILDYTDVILYDIKGLDPKKYKEMTGKTIETTNTFIRKAIEKGVKLWVRIVIIPKYNDTYEYMDQLAAEIKTYKNVDRVELLPYHTLGVNKYPALGLKYPLEGLDAMDQTYCKELQTYLRAKIAEDTE